MPKKSKEILANSFFCLEERIRQRQMGREIDSFGGRGCKGDLCTYHPRILCN